MSEKKSRRKKYREEKRKQLLGVRCSRCGIIPEPHFNNKRVTGKTGWFCDECDPATRGDCEYPECPDDCSWCTAIVEPSGNIPEEV